MLIYQGIARQEPKMTFFTYLTSFCSILHDKSKNTIASPKKEKVKGDSVHNKNHE